MTGNEKIAYRNVRGAFNWIVGGYYNCLQDDDTDYLPESREALINEIYDSAMNNLYTPGFEQIGKAPKEMRFAGKEFIMERIEKLAESDGDFVEIAECCGWEV